VDARILGLQLGARSYAAVQPARDAVWRATPGALYAPHELPNGYRLRIAGRAADEQPGEQPALRPQVLCLPGAVNQPESLLLEVAGELRYRIEFDPETAKHVVREASPL
jgi:hypothetical protein